jgi:hypothetical protein
MIQVRPKNLELLDGQIAWEETAKASMNIQPVRVGLVKSVDWDPITPVPIKYPMTQVGCNIMFAMYKRMNITSMLMYI